jgi:uncharacterized protein YbjT (DUF2867 family)
MRKRIVLAGANGLIGSAVAPMLADAGFDVHVLLRREMPLAHGIICHVAAVDQWAKLVEEIQADTAISCLGTTMRIAGSQAAFAAVDLDLVCNFAASAKASGVCHFIAVSSVGASAQSSNFYLKTKGQMEAAIASMGIERSDFLRPGLLRGERGGVTRYGEQLGKMLSPFTDMLMMGPLQRYRSIAATEVAAAISALVKCLNIGSYIHENEAILALAKGRI